jgi:hypothetical protein
VGHPGGLVIPLIVSLLSVAVAAPFEAGTLIIPMDTTLQDDGMYKGYGLVFALLEESVPVQCAIRPDKSMGGTDFTGTAHEVGLAANTAFSHGYRGGPFLVNAADAIAAMVIINGWRNTNITAVYATTRAFDAPIARSLAYAPSFAVLADGKEDIAFAMLNAAGIMEGGGSAFPQSRDRNCEYPTNGFRDILCPADVEGPDPVAIDGALFTADGVPQYCQLDTMHAWVKPWPRTRWFGKFARSP